MNTELANEKLLMAASSLDAKAIKASALEGADIAQVDKASKSLLHLIFRSVENQEEAITTAHGMEHGPKGFKDDALSGAFLEKVQQMKAQASAALHMLLRVAPAGTLDLQAKDAGYPPIVIAAYLGLGQVVSDLVKRGVDPASKSTMGYTAIHMAAMNSRIGCMRRLAGFGVPVNEQNQQGQTPAHLAATKEAILAMRELKRMGADFKLRNTSGLTAAEELGQRDLKLKEQWVAWENRHDASLRAKRLDKVFGDEPSPEEPSVPGRSRRPRF